MTTAPVVATEDRDGVRIVTLRRPPVNALDLTLVESLHRAAVAARDDAGCAAVVVTGTPGVFSAGIDTRAVPGYDGPTRATMLRTVNRAIAEVYAFPKPTVAAISGHALGGAFVIALACDVRLAARGEFKLGLTEAAAGIPFPAAPLAVVQAELPRDVARVLVLGAVPCAPGSPALRGAVDRVVEPAALLAEAIEEARRLAALPGYAAVKAQLRGETIARLRRIVEEDDDPMLRGAGWV